MIEPFELYEDELGNLCLRRSGQEDAKDVRIRRAFPWSCPTRFVSIRSAEGKELVLIDDLEQIDPAQRAIIERWLTEYSFIPRITRIEQVDVRFGHQEWRVQTDRGPAQFRVQEREDIRFMPDGRFSVKDADGNVYELPRLEELDESSRKKLEALL
ncbi:DUF1854 domain-containing protein [Fontivita pretiosa]|uniref:DUF1854 domain-containing protein n=1 Tax=Fontivita pretiosa TaxID=2989684 RepID=UPI003D175F3D